MRQIVAPAQIVSESHIRNHEKPIEVRNEQQHTLKYVHGTSSK